MKLTRFILALGAFFALAGGIAACGSGVPGNSVADVAGNAVTIQAFNHWMYVAAKGNASQSPGAPVIVPTDPPNFSQCIAQARKEIPSVAKDTNAQLKAACRSLFTSLSGQVMDFLIRGYWYQALAARQHVKVTDAQVQQEFNKEKNQQFQTDAAFQSFLKQTGYTMDDLLFRVRLNQIYKALIAKHTKSVSNADVASYYASHRSQFGTPEVRNLRIVLTKTAAQANAAKAALAAGQSWNAVAKKYSIDPATKNHGGVLNNISQGQEDQVLNQAAFSAQINKVVGPVKGQFGYYVVQVTKITPGTSKSLSQVSPLIKQTLTAQAQSNAQQTVDSQAKKAWLSQTTCRTFYSMADCNGYKAPKGTTTPIP